MILILTFLSLCSSTVYYEERFDGKWQDRWLKPTRVRKGVQLGRVRLSSGDFWGNERIQRGMETMDGHKNYLLYSNFSHRFDSRNHDLIIQYTLRLHYHADCGGQYIKLLAGDTDVSKFSNETEYVLMFGPDFCGATFRRTHVIINHQGKQYQTLHPLNCIKDHLTHAYTLIIRKDNTYEVQIDGEVVDSASLNERFNIPSTKMIPDPGDKKPEDWDDDEWIVDPKDKKPHTWVDDEFIPDPDAFKPPSWDDSVIWVPPMVKNPDYIGEWHPKIIKNPNYKGIWQPKMIEKEVDEDPTFGHFPSIGFIGLEFYQNVPNTIFDNFLVTDDEEYARKMLEEVYLSIRDDEVRNFDDRSSKLRKERELETLRHDSEMDRHHDMDRFTDDDSDSDEQYFKLRREQARSKQKKPVGQFDDL